MPRPPLSVSIQSLTNRNQVAKNLEGLWLQCQKVKSTLKRLVAGFPSSNEAPLQFAEVSCALPANAAPAPGPLSERRGRLLPGGRLRVQRQRRWQVRGPLAHPLPGGEGEPCPEVTTRLLQGAFMGSYMKRYEFRTKF